MNEYNCKKRLADTSRQKLKHVIDFLGGEIVWKKRDRFSKPGYDFYYEIGGQSYKILKPTPEVTINNVEYIAKSFLEISDDNIIDNLFPGDLMAYIVISNLFFSKIVSQQKN